MKPVATRVTRRGVTLAAGLAGLVTGCEPQTVDLLPADETASIASRDYPVELVHRYDFSGTGTIVRDLVGNASGNVERLDGRTPSTLDGKGQLTIADGSSFVRLPGGLISETEANSLTIAIWFTLNRSRPWARVFDFGATHEGGGVPGTALAHFYFTPNSLPNNYYAVVLSNDCDEGPAAVVEPAEGFPTLGQEVAVVVVVEGDEEQASSLLRLYVDGKEVAARATLPALISGFSDENLWLGLSQWVQDNQSQQHFDGSYDELRFYSRALSATEVESLAVDLPEAL